MCCCTVLTCCGCQDLKQGTIIWAGVDAVINLIFAIGFFVIAGEWWSDIVAIVYTYYITYGVLLLVMAVLDIFLAIGAHHDNVCAMIFWQIWNMIIIVCYFCQWTVIPILLAGAAWIIDTCSDYDTDCVNGEVGIFYIVLYIVWIVAMPIMYIYFWIVVNSLRRQIQMNQIAALPIQMTQQTRPVFVQQPVVVAQQLPQNPTQPQPPFVPTPVIEPATPNLYE